MKKAKYLLAGLAVLLLPIFVFVGITNAQSVQSGNNVTVPSGEVVDSMLFATGNNIDIAGEVNGDLYCAGQNITISGTIRGDVLCAGQNVRIAGVVEGSVRAAGQTVTIGGEVTRSVTVTAQTFSTESESRIGRDVAGGVSNATLNGIIGRDLGIGAGDLQVNGTIEGNIKGEVTNLNLTSAARVGGDILYTSLNNPNIADGAVVGGNIERTEPARGSSTSYTAPLAFTFLGFLYLFVSLLLVALALALLFPRVFHESAGKALARPARTVLVGVIAAFAVPIVIVSLFFTIIGIPLALLLLLLWLVVVCLTAPFTGYFLGRLILKDNKHPLVIMLVGATILLVLHFIPILGFVAMLASFFFGTGIILSEAMVRLPKPEYKIK